MFSSDRLLCQWCWSSGSVTWHAFAASPRRVTIQLVENSPKCFCGVTITWRHHLFVLNLTPFSVEMCSQLRMNTKSFQYARNRRWVLSDLVRRVSTGVRERRPAQSFRSGRRIAALQEVSQMFAMGTGYTGCSFSSRGVTQIAVFWILTPCNLVCGRWRFDGSYCRLFLCRQD